MEEHAELLEWLHKSNPATRGFQSVFITSSIFASLNLFDLEQSINQKHYKIVKKWKAMKVIIIILRMDWA